MQCCKEIKKGTHLSDSSQTEDTKRNLPIRLFFFSNDSQKIHVATCHNHEIEWLIPYQTDIDLLKMLAKSQWVRQTFLGIIAIKNRPWNLHTWIWTRCLAKAPSIYSPKMKFNGNLTWRIREKFQHQKHPSKLMIPYHGNFWGRFWGSETNRPHRTLWGDTVHPAINSWGC